MVRPYTFCHFHRTKVTEPPTYWELIVFNLHSSRENHLIVWSHRR